MEIVVVVVDAIKLMYYTLFTWLTFWNALICLVCESRISHYKYALFQLKTDGEREKNQILLFRGKSGRVNCVANTQIERREEKKTIEWNVKRKQNGHFHSIAKLFSRFALFRRARGSHRDTSIVNASNWKTKPRIAILFAFQFKWRWRKLRFGCGRDEFDISDVRSRQRLFWWFSIVSEWMDAAWQPYRPLIYYMQISNREVEMIFIFFFIFVSFRRNA